MDDVEVIVAYFQYCSGENPMLQMARHLPEYWSRQRFTSAIKQALMFGEIGIDEFYDRHPDYDNRDEECA
jgi:hypothetical protein